MYNFIQQAYNQPDLSDAMKSLAKLIYRLEFIQNHIAKSEELKKNPEIRKIDLTCNQILDKHLPELMDEYCKLSVRYRNEIAVKEKKTKEGMKALTSKDILLSDLAHLLEESDILEKSLNDNTNHDFLAKSSFITESFGIQPKIHLEGDEPEKKIQLENEFDSGDYQDVEMQTFFTEFFKKYPEKKIQSTPVIKSRALEEDKARVKAQEIKPSVQNEVVDSIVSHTQTKDVSENSDEFPNIFGVFLSVVGVVSITAFAIALLPGNQDTFQKITPLPKVKVEHVLKVAPVPAIPTAPISHFNENTTLDEQATAIANNMDKVMTDLQQKYKGDYSDITSHPVPSPVAYIDGVPAYMQRTPGYTRNNMSLSQTRVEPIGPQVVSVSIVNIPQKVCMKASKDLQDIALSYIVSPSCNSPDFSSVKIISNENQHVGKHAYEINKIKIGIE
jgi:hypothetical protein